MKYQVVFVSFFAFILLFTVSISAQPLTYQHSPLPCINKTFTVVAHMVRDTFGETNITEQEITDAFVQLNTDFEPICVDFEICAFNTIDNFQYDDIEDDAEMNEMFSIYNEERRINMYFVTSSDDPFCGKATLSGITSMSNPGITIIKGPDCMTPPSKTISHEMGHFFGLLHTFEDAGTMMAELVDGSNCATNGDLVCDTPADPYESPDPIEEYVDEMDDCRFIRQVRDGNGDWFVPDVGNIMSYYPNTCRCGFTHGQYTRMAEIWLNSNQSNW